MTPLISPSILSANFAELGEEVARIDAAGADMIHIDVMDGQYVPNLTIGPMVVKALRGYSGKPFDAHLMIERAEVLVPAFVEAGCDIISIHPEASTHFHRTIHLIKDHKVKAGAALNPATPAAILEPVVEDLDLVLVMSVNPGFGGQKFIESQLRKIEQLRAMIDQTGKDIILEVDGGVTADNAGAIVAAGATALVAGTAVFRGGATNYSQNIERLRGGVATSPGDRSCGQPGVI